MDQRESRRLIDNSGVQALLAASGSLLFGYHLAQISGAIDGIKAYFILPFHLSEDDSQLLLGFLVSVALLGGIFGSMSVGKLVNRYGRKKVMLVIPLIFILTSVLSAYPELTIWKGTAQRVIPLIVFSISRLLSGVALGMVSAIVPLYISEISPVEKRGKRIAYGQMGIVVGILLAYIVNYFIENSGGLSFLVNKAWRYMLLAEDVLAFLVLICFLPLKESPLYLKGVIKSKAETKSPRLTKYGYMALIVGIAIAAFQPFCGINVIFFYAPTIFSLSGTNISSTFLQAIFLGGINFIGTLIALRFVDRVGRKVLYISGAIGMFIIMTLLGFMFYIESKSMVGLILMMVFIFVFANSWGPVTWILSSEVFPEQIRAKALSIGVAGQWLMNYVFAWFFPILASSEGLSRMYHHAFPFWFYAFMLLIPTVIVWRFAPETKGKSNKDIERYWKS